MKTKEVRASSRMAETKPSFLFVGDMIIYTESTKAFMKVKP
jgi:hypothetical protein